MEELYQTMMIDGPDLTMRTKAAERAKSHDESGDKNFNVSFFFISILHRITFTKLNFVLITVINISHTQ